MIKIYFDNNLIDDKYYAELTKSSEIFNQTLKLGSTICETYTFTISKDYIVNKEPDVVYIYDNNTLIKTLYVDNYKENDFTITYELIDSMINFNIPYDASLIMENGEVTLLDIFLDICDKANITTDIDSFDFDDLEVSWFDNTITAREYLSYIAEINAGYFYITADDKLAFSLLKKNVIDTISFDEIGNYKIGTKHKISRVVWDNGLNHWEFGNDTNDTYYINTLNVYVTNTNMVENIYNKLEGIEFYDFEVDNLPNNNYKAGDIISFTDGTNTYKTIVNYSNIKLSGNNWIGGISLNLETNKQEETEIIGQESKIKSIKNIVDRDSNQITTLITETSNIQTNLKENYYTLEQTNQLIQTAQTGITNTFSEAGGNNIFRNTGLWFEATSSEQSLYPGSNLYPSSETFTGNEVNYEFWNGKVNKIKEDKASNMIAMSLVANDLYQEQVVPNGNYTISFKYKKLIQLANVSVKINDVSYNLTEMQETEFLQTIQVNSQHILILFSSDIEDSCEIYDLMVNAGTVKLAYSQNQNETTTDTVNISKGITITSSNLDVTFKANADGIRTLDKNGTELTKFTDTGMTTKKAIIEEKSQIVGTLWQEVGNQTWITKL